MASSLQEKPKKTVLYYPTIAIPTGPWLRKALLYWDEVGSIVPEQWERDHKYPADIVYLKSEGEFWGAPPRTLYSMIQSPILEAKRKSLDLEFRALVSSAEFKRLLGPGKPQLSKHIHSRHYSRQWGIYTGKMTHELYHFLEAKGLVQVDRKRPEWYLFEENTALLYMSLLARYVADVDLESTVVGTDLRLYEKLIYDSDSPGKGFACIDVRFRNALPIPRDECIDFFAVTISQIRIEFPRWLLDEGQRS
jgi:hypothetical protein